jgi:hypothetical protein
MTNPYHPNPWANLRIALQYLLDCEGDGFQLAHFVVALGLQKMDSTGTLTSTSWLAIPTEQADYITQGLLDSAEEMRATQDIDDD